jgi:hypothetical protein
MMARPSSYSRTLQPATFIPSIDTAKLQSFPDGSFRNDDAITPGNKGLPLVLSQAKSTRTGGGDPLVADDIPARKFRSPTITDQHQHLARPSGPR